MVTETLSEKGRPLISVVVLNWNGVEDTLACLDSLSALTYPNFNVIVVDNGSTDDSLVRLRPYNACYPLTLLETGSNLGYAGGNNVGTHYALEHGADFIMILNNDTTVAPNLLGKLVEAAERTPDAGVFSARIMYLDEPERVSFDGARWNSSSLQMERPGEDADEHTLGTVDHDTDYVCGAALFFRADVARQIGLLDESFFLVWEEVDWCFRARKAGWRNMVVPAAKVWHKVAVSFDGENSPLRIYFSTRNKLLWSSRHMPFSARLRLWTKYFHRLIPEFSLGSGQAPWLKRLFWAIQDFLRALLGRGNRLQYLAARRAILDYVFRRFGDCPDQVRAWSKGWALQQKNL